MGMPGSYTKYMCCFVSWSVDAFYGTNLSALVWPANTKQTSMRICHGLEYLTNAKARSLYPPKLHQARKRKEPHTKP